MQLSKVYTVANTHEISIIIVSRSPAMAGPAFFATYVLVLSVLLLFLTIKSALLFLTPVALYLVFAISASVFAAMSYQRLWLLIALPPLFFSCHFCKQGSKTRCLSASKSPLESSGEKIVILG